MENETQTKISPVRKMLLARMLAVQAEKKALLDKLADKEAEITEIRLYLKTDKLKE